MEPKRAIRRRDFYAEKYKQRMDREIIRVHSSMLSLSPLRLTPSPKSSLLARFSIHPVQSTWERVVTSAKRSVILSPEPVQHRAFRLRERRKDLEVQPRMRFPNLHTQSTDYLATDPQRPQHTDSVQKRVQSSERRLKQTGRKQSEGSKKTYHNSMLSLQLGVSVGGADPKSDLSSQESSLDGINANQPLSTGLTQQQRRELFKLIKQQSGSRR